MDSIVNALLFHPPPPHNPCYSFVTDVVHVTTAQGERIAVAHVWRRGAKKTILYSHANSEDLNLAFAWMQRLAMELNVNVVGYDYSGYGASTGVY